MKVLSDCQKATSALASYGGHIGNVQDCVKLTAMLLSMAIVCIEGTQLANYSVGCLVCAVTMVTHAVCNRLGVSSSCLDCC